MTIYGEGKPRERDAASTHTHTTQFFCPFISIPTALQNMADLASFDLHFNKLSFDGPTTLTKFALLFAKLKRAASFLFQHRQLAGNYSRISLLKYVENGNRKFY